MSHISKQNPKRFRAILKRKLKQGKHKMSVINALRNKIIHRVFAVVANQKMYEKDYQYKAAA